jgi:nitroimidazol reductase NimA-like FMN-containing flavoprotein (pyridoxamine 5'-phosphate oxidase superfamily)
MSEAMSSAGREQFLADVHVGILSVGVGVGAGDGRGPLTVPVWYSYQPGGRLSVITGRNTRKARAASAAGRISLCAQVESPPYRYVSVVGPVTFEELDPAERLAMGRRYLGTEGGDQYVASVPDPDGENIVIRIRPERWLSADYGQSRA